MVAKFVTETDEYFYFKVKPQTHRRWLTIPKPACDAWSGGAIRNVLRIVLQSEEKSVDGRVRLVSGNEVIPRPGSALSQMLDPGRWFDLFVFKPKD